LKIEDGERWGLISAILGWQELGREAARCSSQMPTQSLEEPKEAKKEKMEGGGLGLSCENCECL